MIYLIKGFIEFIGNISSTLYVIDNMKSFENYNELTYKIIGCAMTVHRELGLGFQEVVYQRALKYEMEFNSIGFERESEMPIYYKNIPVGSRRVDFYVENAIIVEIKAQNEITVQHMSQTLNYLKVYQIPIGLLINFGSKSLEYKRLHNNLMNS